MATAEVIALAAFMLASSRVIVPGLNGRAQQIFPTDAKRGVVCFFVLDGCPNANAYAPEMNRIAKDYGARGWQFYLAYADPHPDPKSVARHYKAFGYRFPALLATPSFVARSKATMSPEAVVFSSNGDLRYRGRIDNRFFALGKARREATRHDLRLALDAIDAGKPIPHASTPVIGCVLPSG